MGCLAWQPWFALLLVCRVLTDYALSPRAAHAQVWLSIITRTRTAITTTRREMWIIVFFRLTFYPVIFPLSISILHIFYPNLLYNMHKWVNKTR